MRFLSSFFMLILLTFTQAWGLEFKAACLCQDGRSLSPNCESYCSDKKTYGGQFLYAYFSEENIKDWCSKDRDGSKAFCVVEALDNDHFITLLPVLTYPGKNLLLIDASALEDKRDYQLKLKEFNSSETSRPYLLIKDI